jgi:hypothetical protein
MGSKPGNVRYNPGGYDHVILLFTTTKMTLRTCQTYRILPVPVQVLEDQVPNT